jgi:hypothetical protein
MYAMPPPVRLSGSGTGRRALCATTAALGLGCSPDTGLKVNNTPPEASILSHSDGEALLEDALVTFRGKGTDVDDSDAALEAAFSSGGEALCDWAPLGDDGSVACEALVPLASELSDERWSIELEVRDDSGARGFASVGLSVTSTEAPVVTILSPTDGGVAYADVPVSLLGHATDDRDPADALLASWESSLDGLLASGSFDSNGENALSVSLSEGVHDLRLTATDTADKSAATSIELRVFATNTAPSCSFTAPEDGASGRPDEPTTVALTVSDAEDEPEALLVAVASDRDGLLFEDTAGSDGRLSEDVSGLSVGTHELTLTVDDTGGASCTASLTYTIGSAPVIDALEPADETVVNEGEPATLSATITDGEDAPEDLTVEWSSDLDGVLWTAPPEASGLSTFTTSALSRGSHTITVRATDLDAQSSERSFTLVVNGLPGAPEVSLSPDPARTDDALVAAVDVASVDPEGDAVSYSYRWDVGGVASSASTSATLPASATAKGEVWTVTATPTDGHGDGSPASASLTIANTAPVLASVSLSPTTATEGDSLTCTPGVSTDADGDTVSHSTAWTIDGVPASPTGTTLDDSHWAKGQAVTCTVTPTDGTDAGTAVTSNTVTISNAAPSVASVTITPSSPTASDDLSCTYSGFSDPDGDADQSTLAWTVNGTAAGTSATLSASAFTSGDTVVCTVTPDDGTDTGTPVSASVSAGNSAPSIAAVSISPSTAQAGDTLTCSYSGYTDADGDPDASTYAWTINSSSAGTASTLSSGFAHGDTVTCTVTPFDGTSTGTPVSTSITVANTAPSIASVSISPSAPAASDTLTCSYAGFTDADGETDQSTLAWTVNGSPAGTASTLSTGFTSGDTVQCTVTPDDGTDTGTPVSDSVTIQNTAPVLTSVSVSPSSPTVADTLSCSATATDADGDTVSFSYAWTVGATTLGTASTLSSGFSKGDTVVCTVTPTDGTDSGTSGSASATVDNTAPVLSSVSLTPTTATEGDTLSCTPGSASDADGDSISHSYEWFVDSVQVAPTTTTLGDTFWDRGEDVRCEVTPTDGTDSGTTVVSNTVTISNSAPSISAVSISPSAPSASDTLTCSYSGYADADGDADASTTAWTVNGSPAGTGSTLSTGFTSGDTVQCTVTPDDGTDTGTPVSDSVTIQNTAPVLTSVSVSPNTPTVSDTLSCSATATDADGDTVSFTYDWTIGGTTVGTASTLSSGFTRGDTVVCTVTPTDGTDSGSSGSDSELIENAAPSLSAATIAPSSPVYASTLTLGYSTADADGDAVSVSTQWYVDGVASSTASSLSVAASAAKNDHIYAVLTPTDGFDTGSSVTTSTVIVGNTAPTAPSIDATDDPEVGVDDIVCAITAAATDVDAADTLSYVIEWEADGQVYPDDFGSATGPDTTTVTDDTVPAADNSLASSWTCYVVATDGTDDSAEVSDTATVVSASSSLDPTRQGYTYAVTGSYTSNSSNFAIVEPYSFSSAVTVTGFGVNWAFGYCTTCDFGVYDSAGSSATLYGELSTSSCGTTASGNNEVSGASISVPAGSRGLGFNFSGCNYGSTYYITDGGSSTSTTLYYRSYTAGSGLPDPFGATTSVSAKVPAVYPIGY